MSRKKDKIEFFTVKDLMEGGEKAATSQRLNLPVIEPGRELNPDAFGCRNPKWFLDAENYQLVLGNFETLNWMYAVDLERCRNAHEFCDWFFHMRGKTWFDQKIANRYLDIMRMLFGVGEHPQWDVKAKVAEHVRILREIQDRGGYGT